jgi:hypothetical protein
VKRFRYPSGKPPPSLSSSQKEVERKARLDLGSRYFVSARYVAKGQSAKIRSRRQ